jgi:hypothetical protein
MSATWHDNFAQPYAPPAGAPRLLDHLRAALRGRHYSRRTEDAYVGRVALVVLYQCSGPVGGTHWGCSAIIRSEGLQRT